MADLLSQSERKNLIAEMLGNENKFRKEEHRKRFEIYRDRPLPYLLRKLKQEFTDDTVDEMRHITSVNLLKRIIDEKASLYKNEPTRTFARANGNHLSETEEAQLSALYELGQFNVKYKRANKWYELHNQCAIQVVPKNGIIDLKVLAPHQYDVIPNPLYPEEAMAYVVSVDDKYFAQSGSGYSSVGFELNNPPSFRSHSGIRMQSDMHNQTIADRDDARLRQMRFTWWTKELNFVTNGLGELIDPMTDQVVSQATPELLINPLGALPFVDVAIEKDMEFFVRAGSSGAEFALEFLTLLTDTFFIHKMQGYSQAIIYAEKVPANIKVGPNHILHIPLDPNKEVQPRFEWASPATDMSASLELVENFLRLFLTSQGIDPKTVSGKAETQRFSSGIERLLAMVDKFEASRDTIDLFKSTEQRVLDLVVQWSNLFQGITVPTGSTQPLLPQLRQAVLPDDLKVMVVYSSPELVQTKAEKEDSVMKLVDAGLMSRVEAIQELRGVDEETAIRVLSQIDQITVTQEP